MPTEKKLLESITSGQTTQYKEPSDAEKWWNNANDFHLEDGEPVQQNSIGTNEMNGQVAKLGQTDAGTLPVKSKEEEPEIPNAYDELLKTYEDRLKKEEELGKARRGRAAINGIADMGRAIANIVATSQYAPNAYDPAQSLSASAQARYEKAKAERDKNRAEWLNYALKKKALMDDVRDYRLKKDQYKLSERKQTLAEEQEQRRKDNYNLAVRKQDWLEQYQKGLLDDKRERTKIEADYKAGLISKYEKEESIAYLNALNRKESNEIAREKLQGSTTTVEKTIDPFTGKETKRTTTTRPAGSGEQKSQGQKKKTKKQL